MFSNDDANRGYYWKNDSPLTFAKKLVKKPPGSTAASNFGSTQNLQAINNPSGVTFCEYCGLKFYSVQNKSSHQIYYCMGRDLSLNKSLLRLKNNVMNRKLSSTYDPTALHSRHSLSYSYQLENKNADNMGSTRTLRHDILPEIENNNQDIQSRLDKINKKYINKSNYTKMSNSNLKVYVLRLRPNQDLFKELDQFVRENDLKAAFIMTCVGSLTKATIRMAYSGMQHNEVKVYREHMEIVSLVGTLSSVGGHHLHISLSNKDGAVIGGHVHGEMNVFTTAEIVIGECVDLTFAREYDYQSGFEELAVAKRDNAKKSTNK